jgi:hypothetical protein
MDEGTAAIVDRAKAADDVAHAAAAWLALYDRIQRDPQSAPPEQVSAAFGTLRQKVRLWQEDR